MANFFALDQWNINQVDLNFYLDNFVDGDFEQGGSFSVNGQTYSDYFFVIAEQGSDHRRFDLYGENITVITLLGNPIVTGGEINVVSEFDVNAGSIYWFMDGISLDAETTFNAAISASTSDDIQVIESAFSGNDTIDLSPFDDVMNGYAGNDEMRGGAGDDIMDGGTGQDTAIFDGSFAQSTITFENQGAVVIISNGTDGEDRLTNFENIDFNGDVRTVASLKAANSAPTPSAETDTATEDGAVVNGQLSASDADGDDLTFSVSGSVAGLSIGSDGSYSFDPSNNAYQSLAQDETSEVVANFNVSDGLQTASSTLTITVTGVNDDPTISASGSNLQANQNAAKAFSVLASDPDGDALTYAASDPANGTVTGGTDGQFTYTPDNGFTGADQIEITVTDGNGGEAMRTFNVTVSAANSAPVIEPTALEFATTVNTAKGFTVSASDADGDTLTYSAADPANGSVTGGAGGQFTYTPDNGFTGTDTVTVTVTDGNGGEAMQSYVVTVNAEVSTEPNWKLLSSSGFEGSIGGSGSVFGAAGYQEITILDLPSFITLDPSFNAGGDSLHLSGDADEWQVSQSGTSAVFSDGDTTVQVPAGTSGMFIVFDDGDRLLRIDTTEGSLKIGSQAFDTNGAQVSAPSDGATLPTDLSPDAVAKVLLVSEGTATAGGNLSIFGTSNGEVVNLLFGDASLDPSFNQGGDTLVLDEAANQFSASRVGTSILLEGTDVDVLIPVGTTAMTVGFPGGDNRTLLIDTNVGAIVLGNDQIGFDPITLSAFV